MVLAMDKTRGSVVFGREVEEDGYDGGENSECDNTRLPVAFSEKRHMEKRLEGSKNTSPQTWRMKERMKTVSVALVMCLNVGVDPPDVVKTTPCARLECWIDPQSMGPQKALEAIGANLQRQYERWQPRARYKQSLDPTVEDIKKLCTSLRRNAKEERVLFHYTGHGVPRPTVNGEIWVFNKLYTQYIPLSVYDLQTWMGSPSIYVYDCSNAGVILDSFQQFSMQREQELEVAVIRGSRFLPNAEPAQPCTSVKNCIQLAACSVGELLPMNPDLPADLFTSCLTTPIKIALRWYVLQNSSKLLPGVNAEIIDKIPGLLNDRRTMLGELNWIFTAITDTIAWNTLPRDLFQRLFRQDLLVASLFRNFLLAERIMRSYNCSPISSPKLPATYQHPMWQAWDLALDLCLSQLPGILDNGQNFQHSTFFAEQLTAFQVWLSYGSEKRSPPEQLPIVLQVLLSQVHRLRALDLLGRFLDLGPWAVSLALSVGIFPYVLKLLQSSARELRPLLVFIWAKILAVDSSCQTDLVKDNGHKYFLSVLSDQYMPAEHRTMAAFVLAMIVNDYPNGQEAALQDNLISACLEQLADKHHQLRQWLALCLGKVWANFDAARWCGVRDTAHEKLYELLADPVPEVRGAVVFALGTFVSSSTERTDHSNNIDLAVAMNLPAIMHDGSPLVRKELVVAISRLVVQFEVQFTAVAQQFPLDEEKMSPVIMGVTSDVSGMLSGPATATGMRRSMSSRSLRGMLSPNLQVPPTSFTTLLPPVLGQSDESIDSLATGLTRVSSTSSLTSVIGYNNVYTTIWKTLLQMTADPYAEIAEMARRVINFIQLKLMVSSTGVPRHIASHKSTTSHSAPSSPSNKPSSGMPPPTAANFDRESVPNDSRPTNLKIADSPARPTTGSGSQTFPYSSQYPRSRKMFDKGPTPSMGVNSPRIGHAWRDVWHNIQMPEEHVDEKKEEEVPAQKASIVSTDFFGWSCRHFAQSSMRTNTDEDPESAKHLEQEYRLMRASRVRNEAAEEQRLAGFSRLDDQIFINRNHSIPTVLRFHPYEPHMAVADKDGVSVWNWEQGKRLTTFANENPKTTRITAMNFINSQERALLLTGTDDGAVRIWRNYYNDEGRKRQQVTAWKALSEMLSSSRGSGLVVDWDQPSSTLLASGDVRTIRLWDVQKEMKVQEIPTCADSCVTSLSCDLSGRSIIVAGCGDGSVRMYDKRMAMHESQILVLREHQSWVVNAHLRSAPSDKKIVSASVQGDIRIWDQRYTDSIKTINTTAGLTSLEVHNYADVLACGSANQFVGIFNQSGDNLSTIKYHEGFRGQRIGPVTCMAFHPYKVKLVAASTDAFISVYSSPDNRRR